MIIDSHAHIFPFLGGPSGRFSTRDQLLRMQWVLAKHKTMPARRVADNRPSDRQTLWDEADLTLTGWRDVGFKVGKMGRFEWTSEGTDYYMQFMPPSLQDNSAPVDLLLTSMQLAGIDKAVLQYGYGDLNEYFANAIKDHPGVLYGLAGTSDDYSDIGGLTAELDYLISELKLHGLFFQHRTVYGVGDYSEQRFDPFWHRVRELGIPVWWMIKDGDYQSAFGKFARWLHRHPGIPSVVVQGIPVDQLAIRGGFRIPDWVTEVVRDNPVFIELCYAIGHASWEDYPLTQTNRIVKAFYEALGPDKLVWGSDFPNVERLVTLSQSLNHLRNHCSFIPDREMRAILGGNLNQILGAS